MVFVKSENKRNQAWISANVEQHKLLIYSIVFVIGDCELDRCELDKRTALTLPRMTEIHTCIEHFIEGEIGCQLPWNMDSSDYPKCTDSGQYNAFLWAYDEGAKLSKRTIAERTGLQFNKILFRPDSWPIYQTTLIWPWNCPEMPFEKDACVSECVCVKLPELG